MADRPIIFTTPMVRALLDGKKTQTRRVVAQPRDDEQWHRYPAGWFLIERWNDLYRKNLSWLVGDRLWVRETWSARMSHGWTIADARSRMFQEEILYKADSHDAIDGWWPSIHMPREFSRLTLTVTDVRVQQLQEITLGDICAEGLARSIYDFRPVQRGFNAWIELWDGLNAERGFGWDANPWVAALTFTVERRNIDRKVAA
ncbi:hypothetical protein D2T31_00555 [Sinirhodobacter populi]|uniref:Uncharacterized protein n=1 Tax=Paenirhodobacter populi TaxID=2306993 RepID=A0A443KIF9_9RHOB|nr:hypothetical protein [Sinirhodobacter populi]RWR32508.1 hypothetical protein D2T31_00555 [Sinirhodobacter populi]